ncbi:MAG: hypothetical protein ACUVQ9_12415 [Thermodesulfobacteriota bacterium]
MIIKLKSRIFILPFLILIISFCVTINAYAHKVSIYAYAENGMIYSESYFIDGTRCKNSLVEVFDEKNGTKLLEGRTDEEGKFSIKIPKVTSLKLVLNASMGHRAEFTISENEVREAMDIKGQKPEVQSQKSSPFPKEETIKPSISNTEIEAIVENALDKKLQPMMRMLVKLQEDAGKPGITEIIGGIGYIIGILGILAYFKKPKGK